MEKFLNVIEEILEVPKGKIALDDLIEEIEEWDSLANIQIITAIESKFNLLIPIEDIENIKKPRDFLKYFRE